MIEIPTQLAQAIHAYLLSRPMREVEEMVAALRQCEPRKNDPAEGNTASDRAEEMRAERAS